MHFQPARNHHGFHRMQLMEELFKNVGDDEFAMYLRSVGLGHVRNIHGIRNLLYDQPQRSLLPEEHHGTTWVGERAADCIRRNRNRPFFLWAGWIAPHPPFALPEELADLYAGADLPEPTPLNEHPTPPLEHCRLANDYDDPAKTRRVRELYAAAVSHVDKAIGRVMEALEETGQLDNTLVILTSDHGEMLGDNGGWGKSLPNDSAVRIPLVLRYPTRLQAGAVRRDFADVMDIMPDRPRRLWHRLPRPLRAAGRVAAGARGLRRARPQRPLLRAQPGPGAGGCPCAAGATSTATGSTAGWRNSTT